MIVNISIEKLHQHPENPRIDLGDLSELTESIKENGVLQNLTVVPDDGDGYYVVIGNRRLVASRMAGLTELPCAVAEMDYKTQIATMLLENMQRDDLTPFEEAKGIQMMMDLGDTIEEISKKTGLSQTTVRHRAKLNELDAEILEEKCAQNITITDLIKLEQIKDPSRKNEALESIGTNNFDWVVATAIAEETKEVLLNRLADYLSEKASELTDDELDGKVFVYSVWVYGGSEYEDIVDGIETAMATEREVNDGAYDLYFSISGNSVKIYRDKLETEDEKTSKAKEEADKEKQARRARDEKAEQILERTREFVRGVTEANAKKHADYLAIVTAMNMINGSAGWLCRNVFEAINEIDGEPIERTQISEQIICDGPYKALMTLAYGGLVPGGYPAKWDGTPSETMLEKYKLMFDFLETFGYEVSDEERAIADGTHEMFVKVEEEEDCSEYDDLIENAEDELMEDIDDEPFDEEDEEEFDPYELSTEPKEV